MKIVLAILSLFLCLLAEFRHNSVRQYAEINVPSYMRDKTLVLVFTALCFITFALAFIALFDLSWYWCVLISIPAEFIVFFVFTLILESIVHPNATYVSGRSASFIWRALILALILAVIAVAI